MIDIFIHPHALKHGLSRKEILQAWNNWIAKQPRKTPNENQIVCIGYSLFRKSEIQMIAVVKPFGILIYHAMSPAQQSILIEPGIKRRHLK